MVIKLQIEMNTANSKWWFKIIKTRGQLFGTVNSNNCIFFFFLYCIYLFSPLVGLSKFDNGIEEGYSGDSNNRGALFINFTKIHRPPRPLLEPPPFINFWFFGYDHHKSFVRMIYFSFSTTFLLLQYLNFTFTIS